MLQIEIIFVHSILLYTHSVMLTAKQTILPPNTTFSIAYLRSLVLTWSLFSGCDALMNARTPCLQNALVFLTDRATHLQTTETYFQWNGFWVTAVLPEHGQERQTATIKKSDSRKLMNSRLWHCFHHYLFAVPKPRIYFSKFNYQEIIICYSKIGCD